MKRWLVGLVLGLVLVVSGVERAVCLAEPAPGVRAAKGAAWLVAYPARGLPVEKTAAEELALFVGRAAGLSARAVVEDTLPAPDAAAAYVGRTTLARARGVYRETLEPESYVIKTDGGKLFLFGDDQPGDAYSAAVRTGTLYAVYDFLERHLGVTWIWPGATGELVPPRDGLDLPAIDRHEVPDFMIRSITFGSMKEEGPTIGPAMRVWAKRMRLSWTPKAWFGHSWHDHLFKKGVEKEHPEWLALWGGQRRGPHVCTSDPALREFMVEAVLENARRRGYKIVSISPSDGYGFCECEKCRALDPPGTRYDHDCPNLSNRHWDYANAIARAVKKRNPDLGVGMFAYTAYRQPPTNIDRLEDNIYVSFTFSAAYFVKPEEKRAFYEQIDQWQAKGAKVIGREYWGMHYWMDLPYLFTDEIAASTPYFHNRGLVAMYGEGGKNFGAQGPNYFLVSHLMWDAEADSGAILARFYDAFGPARDHVRRYFRTLEDTIKTNRDRIPSYGYHTLVNVWRDVFPEASLRLAGQHLDLARRAVAGNRELEARLQVIEVGYEYAVKMVELLDLYKRLGRAGVPLWFFGPEGDLDQARHYKLPGNDMTADAKEYWRQHPCAPLPLEEKLTLLRRAKHLGEERERILNQYADLPAVSRGLYQYTVQNGIRPWHKTVVEELKKLEADR